MVEYFNGGWIKGNGTDEQWWVKQEAYAKDLVKANMKVDALAAELATERNISAGAIRATVVAESRIAALEAFVQFAGNALDLHSDETDLGIEFRKLLRPTLERETK